MLFERCIVSDPPTRVDSGRGAVEDAIADLDPQADVVLDAHLPELRRAGEEPFDVAEFLWIEVCSWAEQTLTTSTPSHARTAGRSTRCSP